MKAFNLKFHWALGLGVSIPILLFILASILMTSWLIEKSLVDEIKNVRMERNYFWTYYSLINGHAYMPINVYKLTKQDFFKSFPYINIIRSKEVDELFGKSGFEIEDPIAKKVLTKGIKEIVIDERKKIMTGYFPIRSDYSCLVCHDNVERGKTIGVIKIDLSLKDIDDLIDKTKLYVIIFGIISLFAVLVLLAFIYFNLGHKPIVMVNNLLKRITEGDLTFKVDDKMLQKKDIIGDLSKNIKWLQDYLTNFTSKILDFSLNLTKQVDKVYHSVDFANSNIKNLNLNIDEIEIEAEKIFRLVNDISRNLIKFNELLRKFDKSLVEGSQFNNIKQIEVLSENILNLIERIEKTISLEEDFTKKIMETKDVITHFNELLNQINQYVYESLIVSTYLKNLVAAIRMEGIEEKLFDIFETDLDRYVLRIESHVMGIEKLDPIRWSDPQALSLGKWLGSDDYKSFKTKIKDFNFEEFEQSYSEIFNLGREIIISFDREDFLSVDKNLQKFRSIYMLIKGYLIEIKGLYFDSLKNIQ